MKLEGILNVWFEKNGYGFIHEDRDGVLFKYFVHVSNILNGAPRPGSSVLFTPGQGKKGLAAFNVEIVSGGAK